MWLKLCIEPNANFGGAEQALALRTLINKIKLAPEQNWTGLDFSQAAVVLANNAKTGETHPIEALMIEMLKLLPHIKVLSLQEHPELDNWALRLFYKHLPQLDTLLVDKFGSVSPLILTELLASGLLRDGSWELSNQINGIISPFIEKLLIGIYQLNLVDYKRFAQHLQILQKKLSVGELHAVRFESHVAKMLARKIFFEKYKIAHFRMSQKVFALKCSLKEFLSAYAHGSPELTSTPFYLDGPKKITDWPYQISCDTKLSQALHLSYALTTKTKLWGLVDLGEASLIYKTQLMSQPLSKGLQLDEKSWSSIVTELKRIKDIGWKSYYLSKNSKPSLKL